MFCHFCTVRSNVLQLYESSIDTGDASTRLHKTFQQAAADSQFRCKSPSAVRDDENEHAVMRYAGVWRVDEGGKAYRTWRVPAHGNVTGG